jgi:hypothetical protein
MCVAPLFLFSRRASRRGAWSGYWAGSARTRALTSAAPWSAGVQAVCLRNCQQETSSARRCSQTTGIGWNLLKQMAWTQQTWSRSTISLPSSLCAIVYRYFSPLVFVCARNWDMELCQFVTENKQSNVHMTLKMSGSCIKNQMTNKCYRKY